MKKKYSNCLIWLCWLIYACSYIGKANYKANINLIMDFYHVEKAEAGLVSTFFFFAYGIGQVVHGLFCKKYNIRWMIFGSILVSAATNIVVGVCTEFEIVKYVWLINGFCMAILWPTLIRALTETLAKDRMKKATITMGTTVAVGTFFTYALSAFLSALSIDFKTVFYAAAAIFVVVAALWVIFYPVLVKKIKAEESEEEEEIAPAQTQAAPKKQTLAKSLILLCIVTLGIYGVATNLVKDGLTTWMPTILKEQYHLHDSVSIILTLALPVVSIFGNALAVKMHKKFPDFALQCAFNFAVAGYIIAGVIAGLSFNQFVLTLVGFAAVCLLVSSCNSVITSVFPMFMKGKINSGKVAGILNGCCYLGSTITSYGLGAIADNFGWYPVFWLLFGVCALVCVIAGVYAAIKAKLEKSVEVAEESALPAETQSFEETGKALEEVAQTDDADGREAVE